MNREGTLFTLLTHSVSVFLSSLLSCLGSPRDEAAQLCLHSGLWVTWYEHVLELHSLKFIFLLKVAVK